MNGNTLLLFAGLPGVGKSTISNATRRQIGATVVDIDDFKKICVDQKLVKCQIDPPEQRWTYYQAAIRHSFGIFNQGISVVILDEVFHLRILRTQVENLCRAHAVRTLWIEVRCSYDIVKYRLQSRARQGHILSTEEALHMHRMFEESFETFSQDCKNHVVIDNHDADDIDAKVARILEQLTVVG